MEGNIIKSFLVGLGFGVDETSLGKFNKAIQTASTRVTALYGAVQVAAAGIFYSISKISEGFEATGYELKILAPAINKALILRQELFKAYSAAGVNLVKVIQQSARFNLSLTKTQYALKALYTSVAARFFPLLTKQVDIFRKQIYANMPKIQASLEKFVQFIFKAFEATAILGARVWSILGRVYEFFEKLHQATDGWSTVVLAVLAAWNLLNLSFLATPLGALLAGLLAILTLYDDFKTFEEGGKSFFDWTAALPAIERFAMVLKGLRTILEAIFDISFNLVDVFYKLFTGNFSGSFSALIEAFKSVGGIGTGVASMFGPNAAANLANMNGAPNSPLLGGAGASPLVNQSVTQQTSISVTGSPDAQSTGVSVANQQSRVNFDMTRNLRAGAQ